MRADNDTLLDWCQCRHSLIALADEARANLLAGRTEPLDPDQL